MNLDLSKEDLVLLTAQLGERVAHLEAELVHTDNRAFRHGLASDIERLKAIHERLKKAGES